MNKIVDIPVILFFFLCVHVRVRMSVSVRVHACVVGRSVFLPVGSFYAILQVGSIYLFLFLFF